MTLIIHNKMLENKNSHPRDTDITFQENGHIYNIKGDKYYKSCTTWVKSFFEKFDADKIIDRMMAKPDWNTSKYYGMTKDEIKQMWNSNGSSAASYGTNMHKFIEDYYNGLNPTSECIEKQYFLNFYEDHKHLEPYRTEMMIYNEDIKVCGSVDMLFRNEDGSLSIYDWKFSKEIQYENNFGKKALSPMEHLDDCNYMHYSLQLNVYRYILEQKYGYKIKDMYLIFMHQNLGDNYVKVEVDRMDITPMVNTRISNKRKFKD
jgi:hypothetical protein